MNITEHKDYMLITGEEEVQKLTTCIQKPRRLKQKINIIGQKENVLGVTQWLSEKTFLSQVSMLLV